jgi:hypothetical protein
MRYGPLLDQPAFYQGVAASTFSTEEGATVLIGSLGMGRAEEELALTILHETYHVLHPEDRGTGMEERAEKFAQDQWRANKWSPAYRWG